MFVKPYVLVANPFIESYIHSDFLGKMIFLGLFFLSVITWIILLHKLWVTRLAKKNSIIFSAQFELQRQNPLAIDAPEAGNPNPYLYMFRVLKKQTLDLLNKNRSSGKSHSYLSPADIDSIDAHLQSSISSQVMGLEKNLYVLATVVALGPFLGLLGTVWGILTTFSEIQAATGGNTNDMVLSGLSLALATTVLGLLDAIPALIGYNYLKNSIRDYETDMESFSTEILSSVEMHYRKVDVN